MTMARLWWRANRSLVLWFALLALLAGVLGVIRAFSLSCNSSESALQCEQFLSSDGPSSFITLVIAVVPILIGLVLGATAVGGELDNNTTPFSWSIVGSRRRWLGELVLPGVICTILFGVVSGSVNGIIVASLNPGHDLRASFVGYGLWGPLLIARGLCGYAIGLLVGAVTGRVVVSLALSFLLASSVVFGALIIGRSLEPAGIIAIDDFSYTDAMSVEVGALSSGAVISSSQCMEAQPSFTNDPNDSLGYDWRAANCPSVQTYLRGSQMPSVEFRESAVLAAVALACGGLAFVVVANRRP